MGRRREDWGAGIAESCRDAQVVTHTTNGRMMRMAEVIVTLYTLAPI